MAVISARFTLIIIGVLLIQAKRIEAKRTDSGGNWISGNKKDCQAIEATSCTVPDQNRTDAPASGGRCSIH